VETIIVVCEEKRRKGSSRKSIVGKEK